MDNNAATYVPPEASMGTSTGRTNPTAAPPSPAKPDTEANRLEKVLPQIKELAEKVGGYQHLVEIVRQLDRGD